MKSDEILKQALEELMEDELSDIPSDSIFMPHHSFSKDMDDTIEELQRTCSAKRKRRTLYYKQVLSFAASILLLCSCAFCYYRLFQSDSAASDRSGKPTEAAEAEKTAPLGDEAEEEAETTAASRTFDQDSVISLLRQKDIASDEIGFITLSSTVLFSEEAANEDVSSDSIVSQSTMHVIHLEDLPRGTNNIVYRIFSQEDLENLTTSSHLQLPKYYYLTDTSELDIMVPYGETNYLFLAYVNMVQISPALLVDLDTHTYLQTLYIIDEDTPAEVSLSITQNDLTSTEEDITATSVDLAISSWYPANEEGSEEHTDFHVYLTPEEEAKSDLKNNGVIEGVIQLPNTDEFGETTWYDFTPGRYYLFADLISSPNKNYFDGYVTITEDEQVSFDLTSWHTSTESADISSSEH